MIIKYGMYANIIAEKMWVAFAFARQMIHMKCQVLFSQKNNKINLCCQLQFCLALKVPRKIVADDSMIFIIIIVQRK